MPSMNSSAAPSGKPAMSIRIGIVNDVSFATRVIEKALAPEPGFNVIWTAQDGAMAVAHCKRETPDIVLMDLVMPAMNGAEATRRIMRDSPCPILIVTSTIEGHLDLVYEAMGYGALDVTTTPVVGDNRQSDDGSALRKKILDILRQLPNKSFDTNASAVTEPTTNVCRLVLLGASTGGPGVLNTILKALPAGFDAAVIVAQHIDAEFVQGFADWLASECSLPVSLTDGDTNLKPGHVYVLNASSHSALTSARHLGYAANVTGSYYCPSVDILFASAAKMAPAGSIGVLLTGIGSDGAEGLLRMREAGLYTISQSEQSCVVYGMPRAAVANGAAVWVADPPEIADYLIKHIR